MHEQIVRDQYDQMAEAYDRRWRGYLTDTLTFLKTWVELSPSMNVLDIACGTGLFEQFILADEPNQSIIGADLSSKMLGIADYRCQRHPYVAFTTARAGALPYADQSFDLVVTASAFHYFDDPVTALIEMKRVLKPDGSIVILDWCKDYLLCRLCDLVLHVIDPAYTQCYTQAELHRLLGAANLHIERAARVRFGVVWGHMVVTASR